MSCTTIMTSRIYIDIDEDELSDNVVDILRLL